MQYSVLLFCAVCTAFISLKYQAAHFGARAVGEYRMLLLHLVGSLSTARCAGMLSENPPYGQRNPLTTWSLEMLTAPELETAIAALFRSFPEPTVQYTG